MKAFGEDPLYVISPYSGWGPSYRIRVQAWLDRTKYPHRRLAGGRSETSARARRFSLADIQYESSARLSRRAGQRLLIQKAVSRLGCGRVERSFRQRFAQVIFDLDDAVYLPSERTLLGSRSERIHAILHSADRVIAGNDFLAEYCSQFVDDVMVIPTCVDPTQYGDALVDREKARLTVGWIGSSTTARHVETVLPALAAVQRDLDVRVVMVGAEGPDTVNRENCIVDRIPWSKSTEATLLASFDVGIVPLCDTPWEHGKCAYKLLQYGATGVAAIGSPVGVAGSILASVNAPIASTIPEWEAALRDLLVFQEERRRLGRDLRSHVLKHYSYDSWQTDWIAAVRP